jgi:hypothetical protein
MKLEEMAMADLEGIDLRKNPKEIAKKYIKNYKERTGKEFNKQASSALKKLLNKQKCENTDEIVDAAKKEAGIETKNNDKKEKDEVMHKSVKDAAKKAHDTYASESFKDKMLRNAGMIINE